MIASVLGRVNEALVCVQNSRRQQRLLRGAAQVDAVQQHACDERPYGAEPRVRPRIGQGGDPGRAVDGRPREPSKFCLLRLTEDVAAAGEETLDAVLDARLEEVQLLAVLAVALALGQVVDGVPPVAIGVPAHRRRVREHASRPGRRRFGPAQR